jgi:ubiquitin C-terminal hydrolase
MDKLKIESPEINGLQNPGNFCYMLSAIQSLRCILKDFYNHHNIFINYYIFFSKLINLSDVSNDYLLELINIKLYKKELLLNGFNKINRQYGIKDYTNINELDFFFNKLEKEQLKIFSMLLLKQIVDEIENEQINIVNTINFIKVFNICANKNGIDYICNGQQNDSSEFIIILLDYLNDCVNKGKICLLDNKSILLLKDKELNKLDINTRVNIQIQQYKYNTYTKEYSYFHENLNTLILNIIKCVNCGFKQTSINSANNICCSIPLNVKKISLYDCLDNYFKEEQIEYICDKCCKKNENIMYKYILDNKQYIIITIKKFDFNTDLNILTKKHDAINYPLILNINKYSKDKSNNYYLISVVNHVGLLNYGHYYSDIIYNNNWHRCNDENITNLNINNVINNNNAYILIYKRT